MWHKNLDIKLNENEPYHFIFWGIQIVVSQLSHIEIDFNTYSKKSFRPFLEHKYRGTQDYPFLQVS